jgi:branched-subunit amino acid aminotransferase/4-amino-4-deoxychorismate lyase
VGRSGIEAGALRLNWSRGCAGRGIELPVGDEPLPRPRFWLQLAPWRPRFDPITTIVSRRERRNPHSALSRCKTFAYGPSIQARREACGRGADDALLRSTGGELSCGSVANLLVRTVAGWRTPPLASGCLPGVMRARALAAGWLEEEPLQLHDLLAGRGALLINSLGCRPILACEGRSLPPVPEAETLWRRLLDAAPL